MTPTRPTREAAIRLEDYDFELPEARIAQQPCAERAGSKLLVVDRAHTQGFQHARFRDLPAWLEPGDLLVVNATRVESARLRGRRESGGAVEALLLARLPGDEPSKFRALVKLSGKLRAGIRMTFGGDSGAGSDGESRAGPGVGSGGRSDVAPGVGSAGKSGAEPRGGHRGAPGPLGDGLEAEIVEVLEGGEVVLAFAPGADPYAIGEPPLPPYIRRVREGPLDRERYQTVYAREPGAVAAPTAGLHFSEAVFAALDARGLERAEVVLHVGPGTFRPLDEKALETGRLHRERFELPEATAEAIAKTRARGGRVVAVGTTSARVLEARGHADGTVAPGVGETDLFLRPGSKFCVVDALITNFHLPRSSLLLLVAAFAGRERILAAYREAIAHDYRFYSYGDAMLIR